MKYFLILIIISFFSRFALAEILLNKQSDYFAIETKNLTEVYSKKTGKLVLKTSGTEIDSPYLVQTNKAFLGGKKHLILFQTRVAGYEYESGYALKYNYIEVINIQSGKSEKLIRLSGGGDNYSPSEVIDDIDYTDKIYFWDLGSIYALDLASYTVTGIMNTAFGRYEHQKSFIAFDGLTSLICKYTQNDNSGYYTQSFSFKDPKIYRPIGENNHFCGKQSRQLIAFRDADVGPIVIAAERDLLSGSRLVSEDEKRVKLYLPKNSNLFVGYDVVSDIYSIYTYKLSESNHLKAQFVEDLKIPFYVNKNDSIVALSSHGQGYLKFISGSDGNFNLKLIRLSDKKILEMKSQHWDDWIEIKDDLVYIYTTRDLNSSSQHWLFTAYKIKNNSLEKIYEMSEKF